MFASLSPFLVHKWLLLLIFCRVLISLGYLWGIDSFWLSMSDTALPNTGQKQLTTPRKLFENLVYWSCWEVSITCGKMTHRCDLTIAFILNFWQWKSITQFWQRFSARAGPACDSAMCHILSAGNLHSEQHSSWSWQETFWRGVRIG